VAAPVCAAQVKTSAALQAPARIMVEMSFILGSLFRRALPAAEIAVDRKLPKANRSKILKS